MGITRQHNFGHRNKAYITSSNSHFPKTDFEQFFNLAFSWRGSDFGQKPQIDIDLSIYKGLHS